jgi:hypothetical protein
MISLMLAWLGASLVFGLGWALGGAMWPAREGLVVTSRDPLPRELRAHRVTKRVGRSVGI